MKMEICNIIDNPETCICFTCRGCNDNGCDNMCHGQGGEFIKKEY